MDKSELTTDLPAELLPADRIREICAAEVWRIYGEGGITMARQAVDAVLATIIGHTESPRTVDELTRIRGE